MHKINQQKNLEFRVIVIGFAYQNNKNSGFLFILESKDSILKEDVKASKF